MNKCRRSQLGFLPITMFLLVALVAVGCRTPVSTGDGAHRASRRSRQARVYGVMCLFSPKPWINADKAGDLDPEGIRFKVFLDGGKNKGVFRDGMFHIEMYQISRAQDGKWERKLVSDWHYPTKDFQQVVAKILGNGYHVRLRWARKDIAGHEIEVITRFEDEYGHVVRSPTKRLRVPKYVS